ncbi:MAG: hypothetical protein Q7R41_03780 [Phycisphaerales bacterium]|nr:hypothetical protein [Phycisphaerales bacterium]
MNTSDVRFIASPVYTGWFRNRRSFDFSSPAYPGEDIESRGVDSVSFSWVSRPVSIAVTKYCQLVVLGFCRAMCLIDDLPKRGRRFVFTQPAKVYSIVGEMLVNSYRAVIAFIGGSDVVSAVMVQQAAVSGLRQDLRTPIPAVRCRLPGCVQLVVFQGT